MHPILVKIGPLYIYSYGLMVAIGFSVAMLLAYKRAHEFGIDKDKIIDFGIAILAGGLVGARALYVLTNLKYYIANPLEIINLTKGGLIWYGAFLFGIIVAIWFVKKNNINFWAGGDLMAPYIALAQAFGRIGCFLNGCCYGSIVHSDYILNVKFPHESVLRHPAQIYSVIVLILLYVILRRWQARRRFDGEVFLGYALLSSFGRFCLEFLRGDNPKILIGLTMSQFISIGIFVICLAIFIYRLNSWKKKHSASA